MNVQKRHIFYISGFDPRGAAHYQRLYKKEAAKQSAVGGLKIKVGRQERSSDISTSWKVQSEFDDKRVETCYEFLHWDDIVRDHWIRNEFSIWAGYFYVLWVYWSTGALSSIRKASVRTFLTSLFPLVILLVVLVSALGVAIGVHRITAVLGIPFWIALITGLTTFGLLIQCGRLLERKMNSSWLIRSYMFKVRQGFGQLPELDARLNKLADHMVERVISSEADEVLVVGHSSGTIMATIALARALVIYPELLNQGPRVSLLTLGQCIPMLSLLPAAQQFRDELSTLARVEKLDWIDFTAPADAICFPLVNPVTLSGITLKYPVEDRPKLLSPRFAQLFTPKTYAKVRRDYFRNHFQYIMASEKAGEYDYFAITAGHLTLAERYQSHQSVQNYRLSLFR